MEESAVMSWFSFDGGEGSIWSSVSEDGGIHVDRRFRVDNQGYLHAEYYNEELKSSIALTISEFAHVAMVLNKESGFSIYINGNRVAHESSPNNADINLPTSLSTRRYVTQKERTMTFASTPALSPTSTSDQFIVVSDTLRARGLHTLSLNHGERIASFRSIIEKVFMRTLSRRALPAYTSRARVST